MSRVTRAEIFSPNEVAILHVIARVCRRCFLFGRDPVTGKNFDHRKGWIENQIKIQAANFGIDLLAFSLMSNHFHQVLRSRPDVVETWDDSEVARRWLMICPKRKDEKGNAMQPSDDELDKIRNNANEVLKIRNRLSDVSWWMRILCQRIGMRANREDKEVGKFFQGRFKAVRLLDDEAILACSVYVDLNPIRAAIAESIEGSDYTSGRLRCESIQTETCSAERPDAFLSPITIEDSLETPPPLSKVGVKRCSDKGFLRLSSLDYLQLLDMTARLNKAGSCGVTPSDLPPLLMRLGLDVESWRGLTKDFGRIFSQVAGKPESISNARSLVTHRRFNTRRPIP
ncbi:MAG: transposase [Pirellula sp.]